MDKVNKGYLSLTYSSTLSFIYLQYLLKYSSTFLLTQLHIDLLTHPLLICTFLKI